MDYQEFKECLKTYDTLYRQGLKRQANLCIASLVKEVQMLNDVSKDTILYQFTQGLCDAGMFEFLRNRGNGDVPFALKTCLGEWLYARRLKKGYLYRLEKTNLIHVSFYACINHTA